MNQKHSYMPIFSAKSVAQTSTFLQVFLRFFTHKSTYTCYIEMRKLKKGVIVLLKKPSKQHLLPSPDDSFINRLVAIEGDTYIDTSSEMLSAPLDEHYTVDESGRRRWHITEGMVFVCDDNLTAS